MAIRMKRGSGNIFVDVGFPKKEAVNLLIRSRLMLEVTDLIDKRKLTQKRAAKLLGVTQPRISNLIRGRLELFSIDSLVEMLTILGVEIRISARRQTRVA